MSGDLVRILAPYEFSDPFRQLPEYVFLPAPISALPIEHVVYSILMGTWEAGPRK